MWVQGGGQTILWNRNICKIKSPDGAARAKPKLNKPNYPDFLLSLEVSV